MRKEIDLNKKVIVFLILLNVISISTYYSYALFQVNAIKNNAIILKTATNLNITTTVDNSSTDTFNLTSNQTKDVIVKLETDGITSAMAYKMYYEITGDGSFTVTSTENFVDDKIEGIMQPYDRGNNTKITGKVFTLTFTNNSSNTLTIKLGAVSGYEAEGATLTDEIELLVNTELPIVKSRNAEELISELYPSSAVGRTSGLVAVNTDGGLYTDSSTQTIREYRYSGSDGRWGGDVNNYIIFNDEMWRILGILKGTTTDGNDKWNIKIIRDYPLDNVPATYTYSSTTYTLATGTTNISSATIDGNIYPAFNASEILVDGETYKYGNDKITHYLSDDVQSSWYYSNYNNQNGTNKIYKNYIATSNFYYYRSDIACDVNFDVIQNFSSKIGLISIIDYTRAASSSLWNNGNICYSNNIKNNSWLLKPNETTGYYIILDSGPSLHDGGGYRNIDGQINIYMFDPSEDDTSGRIRPVLSLKYDTILTGTGTYSDPYTIVME